MQVFFMCVLIFEYRECDFSIILLLEALVRSCRPAL